MEYVDYFFKTLEELLKSDEILPKGGISNDCIMGHHAITKESVQAIENNIDFFKNIPIVYLREELVNLLYVVNFYEIQNDLHKQAMNYFAYSVEKGYIEKASVKIKRDLKKLKDYEKVIKKIFPNDNKNQEKFLSPNRDLINDLEQHKFEIISKYNYYDLPNSKNGIKEVVREIKEKYQLKSMDAKQLIDEIPSYNYTEEDFIEYLENTLNFSMQISPEDYKKLSKAQKKNKILLWDIK